MVHGLATGNRDIEQLVDRLRSLAAPTEMAPARRRIALTVD